MCIPLTPVLTLLYIVIIEVYLQCFTALVSLRDIGKPTSRTEKSSPSFLYFKAVRLYTFANFQCTTLNLFFFFIK